MTNAIPKSMQAKQIIYNTHLLSADAAKISEYKTHSDKSSQQNWIPTSVKILTCHCKYILRTTWKLIGTLIKHKPTGCITLSRIIRNSTTNMH